MMLKLRSFQVFLEMKVMCFMILGYAIQIMLHNIIILRYLHWIKSQNLCQVQNCPLKILSTRVYFSAKFGALT